MTGGDFAVNTQGLEHYKIHGYKGKLSSSDGVMEELKNSMVGGPGAWNVIKYTHNRGIMHDGDFPHLSTPIIRIDADSAAQKRVILGLNCFPESVGECCARAPEHSQAFNRTVKLYQTLSSLTGVTAPLSTKYDNDANADVILADSLECTAKAPVKKGFSLNEIRKNPALSKLLLTAARKVKEVNEKDVQVSKEQTK